MKKRVWMNLVMAILAAGLLLTVSCAKKTVVTDTTTIEDQEKAEAAKKAEAIARAKEEAERIAQQELEDQMAQEKALAEEKRQAQKQRFENQDIHFEFDSAKLNPVAKELLKEKAVWLKTNSSASVTIEGHCDERGTTEYNLALGEQRANTAKNYLIDLGISAERLATISYGEEQPIASGKTEEAYQKNRRAHFAID